MIAVPPSANVEAGQRIADQPLQEHARERQGEPRRRGCKHARPAQIEGQARGPGRLPTRIAAPYRQGREDHADRCRGKARQHARRNARRSRRQTVDRLILRAQPVPHQPDQRRRPNDCRHRPAGDEVAGHLVGQHRQQVSRWNQPRTETEACQQFRPWMSRAGEAGEVRGDQTDEVDQPDCGYRERLEAERPRGGAREKGCQR